MLSKSSKISKLQAFVVVIKFICQDTLAESPTTVIPYTSLQPYWFSIILSKTSSYKVRVIEEATISLSIKWLGRVFPKLGSNIDCIWRSLVKLNGVSSVKELSLWWSWSSLLCVGPVSTVKISPEFFVSKKILGKINNFYFGLKVQ